MISDEQEEAQSMRVLFVDDEPNVLSGLRRTMRAQRNSWDMRFAEGGQCALQLLDDQPCDVLVSDMKMPGMDGAELLSRVREKFPGTVRIALSGETDSHMIYRCVQHAHQYLAKPCDSDELIAAINRALRLQQLMDNETLKNLLADLTSLPSLPEQYNKIMQEVQSDDPSLQKIGQIIEEDVAMSAKILQLVNSAFFGLARQVSSPAEAAMYLGVDVLKSLVLTTGVFSQFDEGVIDEATIRRIWEHSTAVGALAKEIAVAQTDNKLIADYSMMGGLLSEIGKLVLAVNQPENYREAEQLQQQSGKPDFEVEQQTFGQTHQEIGAYLTGLWGLPNLVSECVAYHHHPGDCADPGFTPLTAVHIASAIVTAKDADPTEWIDDDYAAAVGVTDRIQEFVELAAIVECDESGADNES